MKIRKALFLVLASVASCSPFAPLPLQAQQDLPLVVSADYNEGIAYPDGWAACEAAAQKLTATNALKGTVAVTGVTFFLNNTQPSVRCTLASSTLKVNRDLSVSCADNYHYRFVGGVYGVCVLRTVKVVVPTDSATNAEKGVAEVFDFSRYNNGQYTIQNASSKNDTIILNDKNYDVLDQSSANVTVQNGGLRVNLVGADNSDINRATVLPMIYPKK